MQQNAPDITRFLKNWRSGDATALEDLLPVVYGELRKIARHYRAREHREHTLQTTEIINEAFLKLVNTSETDWQDRTHFFAVAARIMRNFLVDYARTKNYQKRGSGAIKVELDEVAAFTTEEDDNILELNDALDRLEKFDERKAKIVELKYFGGLSSAEAAEVIGVSEITVKREWLKAKAWLYSELQTI